MPQPAHVSKLPIPPESSLDPELGLSNRMAMGLDMMPNREYHAMHRVQASSTRPAPRHLRRARKAR